MDEIETHKIQLQQVEAALLQSADDDELHKLKADLEEVIKLQTELLAADAPATSSAAHKDQAGNDADNKDGKSAKSASVFDGAKGGVGTPARRADWLAERERRKKRQQKKRERLRVQEEAKEQDKGKWQSWQTRAATKSLRGVKKASIFASAATPASKVGVGTCGLSGKPMTQYRAASHNPTGAFRMTDKYF